MRFYQHPITQEHLPSVTTILDATMTGPQRLQITRNLIKTNGLVTRELTRERGNALDRAGKTYLETGEIVVRDPQWHEQIFALIPTLEQLQHGADILETDRVVYDIEHHYAGTIDIVLYRNNQALVLSLKTKRFKAPPRESDWLQILANADALANEGIIVGMLGIVVSYPRGCELYVESNPANIQALRIEWHQRLKAFSLDEDIPLGNKR